MDTKLFGIADYQYTYNDVARDLESFIKSRALNQEPNQDVVGRIRDYIGCLNGRLETLGNVSQGFCEDYELYVGGKAADIADKLQPMVRTKALFRLWYKNADSKQPHSEALVAANTRVSGYFLDLLTEQMMGKRVRQNIEIVESDITEINYRGLDSKDPSITIKLPKKFVSGKYLFSGPIGTLAHEIVHAMQHLRAIGYKKTVIDKGDIVFDSKEAVWDALSAVNMMDSLFYVKVTGRDNFEEYHAQPAEVEARLYGEAISFILEMTIGRPKHSRAETNNVQPRQSIRQ